MRLRIDEVAHSCRSSLRVGAYLRKQVGLPKACELVGVRWSTRDQAVKTRG